jgi:hypothetical protein
MNPHDNVFTRLKQSSYGIGVFAISDIPAGTELFKGDPLTELVKVPEDYVERLPSTIRKLYHDFCPLNEGFYECPPSFDQMGQSWYLNSSKHQNVRMSSDYEHMIAIRDINEGEEIFINYETFSEIPPGEIVYKLINTNQTKCQKRKPQNKTKCPRPIPKRNLWKEIHSQMLNLS